MPVNLYGMVMGYLRDREVVVRYAGGVQEDDFEGLYTGLDSRSNLLESRPGLPINSGTSAYTCRRSRTTWSLCFSGQSASVLEAEANRALAHVSGWGDRNKLRFAPSKTNAMVLTKTKVRRPDHMHGPHDNALVDEIRLLGLTIDKEADVRAPCVQGV
ncbi:hypothetical protein EVAR_23340_1 [Eumeta japonica]|uniref:Uncharacterized protein n=1 Tax=Eumeta variegata TaxID=151549 RepID=A0A4C1Y0W6_EUMVA|nr:hypothetical protein EVAR_23340_1 [Eumeta japonica]